MLGIISFEGSFVFASGDMSLFCNHAAMVHLEYVNPSAMTTGSSMSSKLIGSKNSSGMHESRATNASLGVGLGMLGVALAEEEDEELSGGRKMVFSSVNIGSLKSPILVIIMKKKILLKREMEEELILTLTVLWKTEEKEKEIRKVRKKFPQKEKKNKN